VIVNFDPDTAGANAAEKSISLLTEEGFDVSVVTLDDGLDPDRYIRERGVQAYVAALRGAKRYSDYLIERARQLFPPITADAKVKALNFLLPHIRRMPNRIARDEFATDAAQKLGIDSAVMREELKQAAAKRRDSLSYATPALSEAEKVLLRAMAGAPSDSAYQIAVAGFDNHETHFEGLTVALILKQLRHRGESDPMQAIEDPAGRGMLANVLNSECEPLETEHVRAALDTLRHRHLERRQRELRATIADAERKGDSASVIKLTAEKLAVDRELREF